MYPKNPFPAHTAFLADSLFGANLKLHLTLCYSCKSDTEGPASPTEQSYPSVRSSYSCVPQQLSLMTNPQQKTVV